MNQNDPSGATLDSSGASGTGGIDLASLFSNLGQAFTPGGTTAGSPAATVNAITQATDPTGSIAAQTAITGGQNAPQPSQGQNPRGDDSGDGQQGQNQQFAPPSAVEDLKKALVGLTQQQRQNPYGFPTNTGNAAAGQNSPMLNRAGRIPTSAVLNTPPQRDDPNAPSQDASNVEFSNDNPPPPNNAIDPADAIRAGLRSNAPDTGFRIPGAPANTNEAGPSFGDYLNKLRGNVTEPATPIEGLPPAGDPSSLVPGGGEGLGGLAGLARRMGLLPAAAGVATDIVNPTPAETGELPRQTLGRSPSGPDPITPALGGGPGNEEEAPTGTAVTKAPVTGKPVKTVDPKTNKPVDPRTGDPLPTKKEPLPTHVGPEGHGPIARDMGGVSTGVPPMLGQLAQFALPLMMMAMSGMGGGGRRGGGGIGRRWGHPGGFGGRNHFHGGGGDWPYHHPQFGWQTHGGHPGGGWKPMHPNDFRQFRRDHAMAYGGDGNMPNDNPAIQAIMQAMSGGQQGQQGQQGNRPSGQSGFGRPQGGGLQGGGADPAFKGSGLGDNPFVNTLVGQESGGGQNIISQTDADSQGRTLAQGGNPNEISQGYFQIQNYPGGTWQTYGKAAGVDLSKYPTPKSAPLDVQWKVAQMIPIGQWGGATKDLLRRRGFNFSPHTPMGQVAQQFGNTQIAGQPGTTVTGGSKGPNPNGNPATVDTTPPYTPPVPTQMGAEGGVQV